MKVCSIDGCEKRAITRGWCPMHYERWRRWGTTELRPKALCSIEGCGRDAESRGWCNRHYEQWRRTGDPIVHRESLADRFWSKVDVRGPDECWPWLATKRRSNHGQILVDGHQRGAHQVAWFLTHGVWPKLDLDHTCHNGTGCDLGDRCPHRACCNPAHMEEVTRRENTMRGNTIASRNAAKTHCVHGHPLFGDNLRIDNRGHRRCRICERWAIEKQEAKRKIERRAKRAA